MAYLLDANIFIEAKNHYYGFNICPGFWTWLDHAHEKGVVLSIKHVREELMGRKDRLSIWSKPRTKMFVDTTDSKTYDSLGILATWVSENYSAAAQNKFFKDADFVLIGHAHAHNHTVVTVETACAGLQVKIPNACKAMNVPCITPFQMLETEKVKFYFPT